MKRVDPEAILILSSELEQDLRQLEKLEKENAQAMERIEHGARESLDFAALGYTIHNIYCLMENSFLRIAKTFENKLDKDAWHRSLLRRMTLEIPGVRPALLDEDAVDILDELRSFRHVFRNLYQTGIKPEKVLAVQRIVPEAVRSFRNAVKEYVNKLKIIGEEL
jgi:hypothetical protein